MVTRLDPRPGHQRLRDVPESRRRELQLYRLDTDWSECHDLAAAEPDLLARLIELWWHQAERHGVLPLDDRGAAILFRSAPRPGLPTSRTRFVYYPPISHIVSDACPSAGASCSC